MKNYMELFEEFKKTCDNEYLLNDYKKVCEYIDKKLINVKKIKRPLTGEEFSSLYHTYATVDIITKLEHMESWHGIKNYTSLYFKLKEWLERDDKIKIINRIARVDFEKIKRMGIEAEKKKKEKKKKKMQKRHLDNLEKLRKEGIGYFKKKYKNEYHNIPSENENKALYKKMAGYIKKLPNLLVQDKHFSLEDLEYFMEDFPVKAIMEALKEANSKCNRARSVFNLVFKYIDEDLYKMGGYKEK